jgi:hypothetical protein
VHGEDLPAVHFLVKAGMPIRSETAAACPGDDAWWSESLREHVVDHGWG